MRHEGAQLPPLWEAGLRLTLMAVLALGGCSQADPYAEAKQIAADTLKDPESARFREVRPCMGSPDIIQGQMNGKNSFGAYAGYEDFWIKDSRVFTVSSSGTAEEFTALMAECSGMTVEEFKAL